MAIAGLSARLYLDHNVDPQLAVDLRRHGFDVVVAKDIGYRAAQDEEHLTWAAEHGRTIFSYDLDDYAPLADEWFIAGREHAGIILSESPPALPYGVVLRRLLALLDQMAADELRNQVLWLDAAWLPNTDN